MNFEEIQNQAKAEWKSNYQGKPVNILVGTATCGQAAGALAVVGAFQEELKRWGVEAKVDRKSVV